MKNVINKHSKSGSSCIRLHSRQSSCFFPFIRSPFLNMNCTRQVKVTGAFKHCQPIVSCLISWLEYCVTMVLYYDSKIVSCNTFLSLWHTRRELHWVSAIQLETGDNWDCMIRNGLKKLFYMCKRWFYVREKTYKFCHSKATTYYWL